jgi:ssDNA-binding Zn-finger/Zn-ribbon topoisomerase 1
MVVSTLSLKPTLQSQYPASTVLVCPECGGDMILRKSPKFPKPFYGCTHYPMCCATHGAHPDGSPLGIPANAETKRWRIAAHAALDPLWGRDDEALHQVIKKRYRHAVYDWLAYVLQIMDAKRDCHIARFDIHRCQQVIEVCKGVTREQILNWHQARFQKQKPKRKRRPPRYAHY